MAFSQKNRKDKNTQLTTTTSTNTTNIGEVGITGNDARDILVGFANSIQGIVAAGQASLATSGAAISDLGELQRGATDLSLTRGWAFAAIAVVAVWFVASKWGS